MKKTLIAVRIPEDLNAAVNLLLADELGRVRYGSKSRLVEALLRQWVESQRTGGEGEEGGDQCART